MFVSLKPRAERQPMKQVIDNLRRKLREVAGINQGLRACHADPADMAARLDCQLGAWMSMVGSQTGVSKGASHGIGHVLGGTAGVPHGYTSCVMLPHVLRFNKPVNAARQAWVAQALGMPLAWQLHEVAEVRLGSQAKRPRDETPGLAVLFPV